MTYLELWQSLDLEGRRKRLIESSFRMVIGKGTAWPEKVALQEALVIEGDAVEPAPVSLAE
jgi:hypothetical protein